MIRRLFGLAFLALSGAMPLTAGAPDWLQPHLRTESPGSRGPDGAEIVFSSCEVRYLAVDRVRRTYRQAVRVLSESGRSHANAGISYYATFDKVVTARGWVADVSGKRVAEIGRSEFADVVVNPSLLAWSPLRAMHFEAAGRTAVGGLFAWEIVIDSQGSVFDQHWSFRGDVPVRSSTFEVIPPSGAELRWRRSHDSIPEPVRLAGGALRWQMSDIATSHLPVPEGFLLDELEVTVQAHVPGRREGELRDWDEFNRLISEIVEPRIERSDAVRVRAAELTRGLASRWERIRALCEFVQRDVQYLALMLDRDYLAGYRPHGSTEVLTKRVGDCKDKAALLIALLRAIGEDGGFVLVHARDRLAISDQWPTTGFNHAIAAIPADSDTPAHWPVVDAGALGRLVLFDPTHPGIPLGALPAADQGRFVFISTPRAGACVASPSETPAQARVLRTVSATIERSGSLAIHAVERRPGSAGAELHHRRTALRAERFGQEVAQRLQQSLPAIEGLEWTDTWDAAQPAIDVTVSLKAPRFVRSVGTGRWLIRPHVLTEPMVLDAWETPLAGMVWLPTLGLRDTTRLTLPAGIVPESLPADVQIEADGFVARCTYRFEDGVLTAEMIVDRPARLLDRDAYARWRTVHERLDEAVRAPLMLRPVPPQPRE